MHSVCEAPCCGSSSAETSAGLSKFQLGLFSGNLSDDQVVDALPAPWHVPHQPHKAFEFSVSVFIGFPN